MKHFKTELLNGKIILCGDLDKSDRVRQNIEETAMAAVQNGVRWVVDAQKVRLHVGGEEIWSEVAQKILSGCQLVYLPSQLAMNLQYDDQYGHADSTFLETDDECD